MSDRKRQSAGGIHLVKEKFCQGAAAFHARKVRNQNDFDFILPAAVHNYVSTRNNSGSVPALLHQSMNHAEVLLVQLQTLPVSAHDEGESVFISMAHAIQDHPRICGTDLVDPGKNFLPPDKSCYGSRIILLHCLTVPGHMAGVYGLEP